jgi:deoxyribodipyrimidine photolyase-related protein
MKTLRFFLGDQPSRSLSALRDLDPTRDVVLMVEAHEETTYVRHHRQKIVLVFSAMGHFAESLYAEGLRVDYVRLDDTGNAGSFTDDYLHAEFRSRDTRTANLKLHRAANQQTPRRACKLPAGGWTPSPASRLHPGQLE